VTTRRLFFSLWPDDRQRDALWSVIQALCPVPSGRPVPARNLHVTLAFLGSVAADRIPSLRAVAAARSCPAADLVFDRLAWWPRARLRCLEAHALPEAFVSFVEAFHDDLRAAGFEVERRPFRAHITVARNVSSLPSGPSAQPVPGFVWPIRGMALVASTPTPDGSVYDVLERF
jgi:RNA 2',3'-cyclic 3'-phosphodiesterase